MLFARLRTGLTLVSLDSRPSKTDPTGISTIVPFATHVDQSAFALPPSPCSRPARLNALAPLAAEHDLDVIVTDQGLADVRGLSPRQRAPIIIKQCAHPDYRDQLLEYHERALHECLKKGAGHEPHMLRNAFKMHLNLEEKGTMKLDKWD